MIADSTRASKNVEAVYSVPAGQALLLAAADAAVAPMCFAIRGAVDPAILKAAWEHVVAAYPALRTFFVTPADGTAAQVIAHSGQASFVCEDWRTLGSAEQAAALDAYLARDARTGVDTARLPLVRLALIQTEAAAGWWVVTRHRAVLDDRSVALVLRSAVAAYDALLADRPLPAVPPQRYREYLAWCTRQDADAVGEPARAHALPPDSQDLATWASLPHADARNLEPRIVVHGATFDLNERCAAGAAERTAHRIPLAPRDRDLPASYAQERLWFLQQLEGASSAYHAQGALRLSGELRIDLLNAALDEIVRRHESLRTVFRFADERLVQIVEQPQHVPLELIDLQGKPEDLDPRLAAAKAEPFNLAHGPMLRCQLLRTGPRDVIFAVTIHHIVTDGWSRGVFFRELTALYATMLAGEPSPLAPLAIQYADYAVWQRAELDGSVRSDLLDYWKKTLAGAPLLSALPTDVPRSSAQVWRGATSTRTLPAGLSRAIRKFANAHGATTYMVLLAALQVLVARASGQRDVVIGTPSANRGVPEIEPLIGFFVNALALRTDLSGNPTFTALLARVRDTALDAYAHQALPFDQLVEEVAPARDLGRNPLFQIFFNMLNVPQTALELAGLRVEEVPIEEIANRFDLTIYAQQNAERLRFDVVFNAELYACPSIERWLRQLELLLDAAVATPDAGIETYSLRETAPSANGAPIPYADHGAIQTSFAEHVLRAPERLAIADTDGRLTYGELDAVANRIAYWLRAAGCGSGDAVAVCAAPSGGFVAALLGVLKAGALFVVLDPAQPPARLRAMAAAARPRAMLRVAPAGTIDALGDLPVLEIPAGDALTPERFLPAQPAGIPDVVLSGRSSAYIAFTSGTTGTPLGIRGTHGPVSHFLAWQRRTFALEPHDRFSLLSGLAHDPALRDIFAPLALGASLHIPAAAVRESPERLARWLADERISVAHLTPAMAQLLAPGDGDAEALDALRLVFFGGDRLRYGDVRRLAVVAPACRFINFYGTTETPQAMAFHPIEPAELATQPDAADVPLGRALDGVALEIRNDLGEPCGPGELGELWVRTPYLTDGYIDPANAAQRFAGAWPTGSYRTGDLARYRDDGSVTFAGRRDTQLKIRGFRVEPLELEAALGEHPAVRAAAAIAFELAGEPALAAIVVAHAGTHLEGTAIRHFLSGRVPAELMPARVLVRAAMPLTPNGKLDRAALAVAASQLDDAPRFEAPSGPVATALAAIWCEVLGRDRVGASDDFFALGGHSLKAVRVASRIARDLGVEIPLRTLFAHPSLGDLAAAVGHAQRAAGGAIATVPPAAWYPASHAQRRLWSLSRLGHSAAYNMQHALVLAGKLDRAALSGAFAALVARHEGLRTTFSILDGDLAQTIAAHVAAPIVDHDLRQHPDPFAAARAFVQSDARAEFALDQAPPLRIGLLRVADDRHILVFNVHHIVADGWSIAVLIREFAACYDAQRSSRPHGLAPLRVQYKDFSAWQRTLLDGSAGDEHRAYWHARLAAPLPVLDLPADHPRPATRSGTGGRVSLHLDATLTRALATLGRHHGASLYMTLLALVKVLIFRLSDAADAIVGCPVAGRNHVELEDQFGCYVNIVALRDQLDRDTPFAQFLGTVAATVSAAFEHQEYPFDRLVAELAVARDVTRSPIFDVVVTLQNGERPDVRLDGLLVEAFETPSASSKFDLTFTFEECDGAIGGFLEYNADLFLRERAQRMAAQFTELARNLAADPAQRAGSVNLLPAAERAALVAFNPPPAPEPPDDSLVDLFERQAEATPDAPAVTFADRTLTYRELNGRANTLAGVLRAGAGPPAFVGVVLERSELVPMALLAILKAGAAYVPIESTYPEERVAFMLHDANCGTVVSDAPNLASLRTRFAGRIVDIAGAADVESANLDVAPTPDQPAYVIYTSGSTGRPKGCVVTHRNVVRLLKNDALPFDFHARDTWVMAHAAAFDFSVWEMFGALLNGGRLVVAPRDVVRNPAAFRDLIRREHVTVLNQTPAAFDGLIEVERGAAEHDLGRYLRYVIFGGDRLTPQRLRDWVAFYPLDRVALVNMYGITETTVHVTFGRLGAADISGAAAVSPIGVPLPQTRVYVCDAGMNLQPIGVPGELYVGGSGVCAGYLNRPELNAARFIASPFQPAERLYRSGDLGRWRADGTLEHLGRNDAQLQIRGFRVELGEVTRALESAPDVREAVVAGWSRSDDPASGDQQLVAWIVLHDATTPDWGQRLRAHLRETLPEFMVPAHLLTVAAIPLTSNGKIDRARLPVPREGSHPAVADAPGDLEAQLTAIWGAVLQRSDIGPDDNFFDIGGHSLLLIQVHRRVQEVLERDLPLVELFRYPTVRSLAGYLRDAGPLLAPVRPSSRATASEEIAIIGMAGRFPGAASIEAFWANLRDGVESSTALSDELLLAAGVPAELLRNPRYVREKPLLADIDAFDAGFFGISDREAAIMDPQHRIFLECAWEALENAGYDPATYAGRIGVYAAAGFNSYLFNNVYGNRELIESLGTYPLLIGNDRDFLATRVSYKLNLNGPSMVVGTACSGSMVAVQLACQSLQSGACDMALAGGISIKVPQHEGYLYDEGGILSPDGHCRAFDARAQGTVGGSGAGIVMLKRLADAVRDGDHIAAVIRGIAVSNDGSDKIGYTAPSIEGQAAVIAEAQARAGVSPESVTYVEAHGTGTALGDPIEVTALAQVFRTRTSATAFCALGSVKTNIGHLDAAAGIAGLIKTVLALQHRQIPASLNFEQPNAGIDFAASPFFVNTRLRTWERSEHPRRAGVSSFGLGGTNVHAVLDEAPEPSVAHHPRRAHLLQISAPSQPQLDALTERLAARFTEQPGIEIADAAFTLAHGRRAFAHRRALVAADPAEAAATLQRRDPRTLLSGAVAPNAPAVALLFPGGGAQYAGMGRDLYAAEPVFRAAIDRCGVALDASAAELRRPSVGLPALFAVEYALAQLMLSRGVRPAGMIGHSQGEYVAACIAGVFSVEDALAVVAERARLFERTARGAMLGIPLSEDAIAPLLGSTLSLAAVNLPDACVVAGPVEAVAGLADGLATRGIDSRRLHIDVAAHSALLDPILDEFRAFVRSLRLARPALRFVSNLTGTWITDAQATDPDYWVEHLRRTVRFADGLGELTADPATVLLELGPGNTLASLAQRHPGRRDEQPVLHAMRRPDNTAVDDRTHLLTVIGRLWTLGIAVDADCAAVGRRIPLPGIVFARKRHWIDPQAQPQHAVAGAGEKKSDVRSWVYLPSPRRTALPTPLEGNRSWLVVTDDGGVGAALAARFAARGDLVTTCLPGSVLDRSAALPDHVVFAAALDGARNLDAFVRLAAAVSAHPAGSHTRLTVITSGAQDITGTEALEPSNAAFAGPVLVIGQENPTLRTRAIDVVARGNVARTLDQLEAELSSEQDEAFTAYRGPHRWTRDFAAHAPGGAPVRLRQRGVYLITGGTGGVGVLIARFLAGAYQARLVLLARHPGALDATSLREIEACAGDVTTIAGDVADPADVRRVLTEVRLRHGTLDGVVHAAGVTSGDSIFETFDALNAAAFAEQAHPKLAGAECLAAALAGETLDFVLLISSNAAVVGGLGLAAYAAANACMDLFAVARNRAGRTPWISASWDGWPTARRAARKPEQLTSMDRLAMTAAECEEALRLVLAGPAGHVVISAADLHARLTRWTTPIAATVESHATVLEGNEHAHPVAATLAALWCDMLGVERVGAFDNFFELRGDSLLGSRMITRANVLLGVHLPLRSLFEAPTIAGLTERIVALQEVAEQPAGRPTVPLQHGEVEVVI